MPLFAAPTYTAVTSSSVTLDNVPAISAGTSLNIDRATDSGFTQNLTTFKGIAPSTNYVDNTVAAETTYYYRYVPVSGGSADDDALDRLDDLEAWTPPPPNSSAVTSGGGATVNAQSVTSGTLLSGAASATRVAGRTVPLTLLMSAAQRGAFTVSRAAAASLLLASAARAGTVAPAGSTTPPYVFQEGTLLSSSASAGPLTMARAIPLTLLTSRAGRGTPALAPRTISLTLLSSSAGGPSSGTVTPAPNPGLPPAGDPFPFDRTLRAALVPLRSYIMNPVKFLPVLDKIAASYRSSDDAARATELSQLLTLIIGQDGISGTAYGTGDEPFIVAAAPVALAQSQAALPAKVTAQLTNPLMQVIGGYLALPAVNGGHYTDLDTYCTYQNGLARFSFLVAPNLAFVQWLYQNQAGTRLMSPGNVFAPATTFGTATVNSGGGSTLTPGAAIRTVSDPVNGLQGYTPAPGVLAQVTAAINGTLAVTVTGSGVSAAGAAFTGHTWTANLGNAAAGASVTLTPGVPGDRISQVTGLSAAGTATAGTFSLVSVVERVLA